METTNSSEYRTGRPVCPCFDKMKHALADQLHIASEALSRKMKERPECGMSEKGKRITEWLDKSANYVRDFDYQRTDAEIRESVRNKPGRAMLIAASAGFLLSLIFRRR